jgi:hypothetical protein
MLNAPIQAIPSGIGSLRDPSPQRRPEPAQAVPEPRWSPTAAEEQWYEQVMAQDAQAARSDAPSLASAYFTQEQLMQEAEDRARQAYRGGPSAYRALQREEQLMQEAVEHGEWAGSMGRDPRALPNTSNGSGGFFGAIGRIAGGGLDRMEGASAAVGDEFGSAAEHGLDRVEDAGADARGALVQAGSVGWDALEDGASLARRTAEMAGTGATTSRPPVVRQVPWIGDGRLDDQVGRGFSTLADAGGAGGRWLGRGAGATFDTAADAIGAGFATARGGIESGSATVADSLGDQWEVSRNRLERAAGGIQRFLEWYSAVEGDRIEREQEATEAQLRAYRAAAESVADAVARATEREGEAQIRAAERQIDRGDAAVAGTADRFNRAADWFREHHEEFVPRLERLGRWVAGFTEAHGEDPIEDLDRPGGALRAALTVGDPRDIYRDPQATLRRATDGAMNPYDYPGSDLVLINRLRDDELRNWLGRGAEVVLPDAADVGTYGLPLWLDALFDLATVSYGRWDAEHRDNQQETTR